MEMGSDLRRVRRTVCVADCFERIRFSDFAEREFGEFPSRKAVKKAIKKGLFLLNGEVAHSGDWVGEGMSVVLLDFDEHRSKHFDFDLEIVYEDDFVAVVNKPSGLPVSGNKRRTVQNALVGMLTASKCADFLEVPRPVHRLDSLTSGVLVVAKTYFAASELGRQFSEKTVKKEYSAILHGILQATLNIDAPIEGKRSLSDIVPLYYCNAPFVGPVTFVHLYPHTGRTHQLRIHCAIGGHSILGDRLHCPVPTLTGKGLFLCSTSVQFAHPDTGQIVQFSIDVPHKFERILARRL